MVKSSIFGFVISLAVGLTRPTDAAASNPMGRQFRQCHGNSDTAISRDEFPSQLDETVHYVQNQPGVIAEDVNTTGLMVDGVRRWDFSERRTDDQSLVSEAFPPQAQWWGNHFPDATYGSLIDPFTGLTGVYQLTDSTLGLLGTISSTANETHLHFSQPVEILKFPLYRGANWRQTTYGTGTVNFSPFRNVTRYQTRVDLQGELSTPKGRFPVLRVNTEIEQTIPLSSYRRTLRIYTFVSECQGVVARVASTINDTAENFSRASEYRRLAP
jgi:hypothetical protein